LVDHLILPVCQSMARIESTWLSGELHAAAVPPPAMQPRYAGSVGWL
jgi:hypothetical protein